MPQADVLTNGALISAVFPLFIPIFIMLFDNYDDSAIQGRLLDFTETAVDTDRTCLSAESNMQELVYSVPIFIQEYLVTNFPALQVFFGIQTQKNILSQFEDAAKESQLTEMAQILREHAADISVLDHVTTNVSSDLFYKDKYNLYQLAQVLPNPLPAEIVCNPIFVKGLLPDPDPFGGVSLSDLSDGERRLLLPNLTSDAEFYRQIESIKPTGYFEKSTQRSAPQMGILFYKGNQIRDEYVDSYLNCNREDFKHIPRIFLEPEMQLALIRYFFRDTELD